MGQLAPRKKKKPKQIDQFSCDEVAQKPDEVDLGEIKHLAVICCYFNPMRCSTVIRNTMQFLKWLEPTRKIVSANFGHQPDLFSGAQLNAGPEHLLWQKERMLNLAEKNVPDQYDAIAWIDMDVMLLNPNWIEWTKNLLSTNHVCQLWSTSYERDAFGNLNRIRPSVASAYNEGKPDCFHLGRYHPGFAWAMRRDTFHKIGGLLDTNIVGNGDTHMCRGFFNADLWTDRYMSDKWRADTDAWREKANSVIQGHVGCVPGDLIHFWHGDRTNRKYVERLSYLGDHDYDPATDIEIDPANGLYRWTDYAQKARPAMIKKVKGYFHERAISVQP